MKIDEYNALFDSMEIRDDVYDDLVADTLRKHRKRRRKRGEWIRYAIAAVPVCAVLCLVILLRLPRNWEHGAAGRPVELEKTTEMATVPPTSEAPMPAPGQRASELFAMSGVQPVMTAMQQELLNIAVETYFDQYEAVKRIAEERLANPEITDEEAQLLNEVCGGIEMKPNTFYYLQQTGQSMGLEDMVQLLTAKFGEIYPNGVFRQDDILRFNSLIDSLHPFSAEHLEEGEELYQIGKMTFSMQCAEGLDSTVVAVIECAAYGSWFFYEFAPSEQGTMVVSAGYCPEATVAMLLDGTLDGMGYTVEAYAYYDFRWGAE